MIDQRLEVLCANCRRKIDVNKHIVTPPERRDGNVLHYVEVEPGFLGTVRCPECGHYTHFVPTAS